MLVMKTYRVRRTIVEETVVDAPEDDIIRAADKEGWFVVDNLGDGPRVALGQSPVAPAPGRRVRRDDRALLGARHRMLRRDT
jgi:hypothetical protein